MAAVRQVRTIAMTAMNTELISHRNAAGATGPSRPKKENSGAVRFLKRFWKLVATHSVGHQTGSWL